MPNLIVPHNFRPRDYQLPILRAIDEGYKHIYFLVHRRGGKDVVFWNGLIKRAVENKGTHFYLLPEHKQARKVIWDGMTNDGQRFLDYIPQDIIAGMNGQEMKITLKTGSIIQLAGTDNYDSLRGTNPKTIAYSEYAFQNPMAREVMTPILRANGGVEMFNTTPNGNNHAKTLWDYAGQRNDWFRLSLDANHTGVFTKEALDEIRAEYIAQGKGLDMFEQEYMNSWDAAIKGSFYSNELKYLEDNNHICNSVYNPDLLVYTAWDIGFSDDTAIVFYQILGKEVRIIDYHEDNGKSMSEYASVIKSKPYRYATHYFPWDAKIKAMSSGKSTIEVAHVNGLDKIEITPQLTVQEGIQQVRAILPRCYFDKEKTFKLINSLKNYHRKYDEQRKAYTSNPFHDWASHGADSFRYASISINDIAVDTTQEYNNIADKYIDTLQGKTNDGVWTDNYFDKYFN